MTIIYKYFILIVFLTQCCMLHACSNGLHHSVMSHYNSSDKVFKGSVICLGRQHKKKESFDVKALNVRGYFVKFKIEKAYKNCQKGAIVCIGVMPTVLTQLKLNEQFLVYAAADNRYEFLITELVCSTSDSSLMHKHALLEKLGYAYSGPVAEYSSEGKLWAAGQLKDGLPEGTWSYYALSGALQLQGSYQDGLATGCWRQYYVTNDKNYTTFKRIVNGNINENVETYQFLSLDTLANSPFKYVLSYTVGTDTLKENYLYNDTILYKKNDYHQGIKHGNEHTFDEKGQLIKAYHFVNNQLEGDFFELYYDKFSTVNYWKATGKYRADCKIEEWHHTFRNNQLINSVLMYKK